MTQSDVNDLAKQAAKAEAALRQAEEAAKAAKAALKAARPSQLLLIRRAVISDESITTKELLTTLAERGHPNAKEDIVASYRSDTLGFLRVLREMGRLLEIEPEPEPEEGTGEEAGENGEAETEAETPTQPAARSRRQRKTDAAPAADAANPQD